MVPLLGALVWWTIGATAPSPAASADVVVVDGVGPVMLAGFDCVSIARSGTVSRVCHDAYEEVAIAQVHGRHRLWCDVPRTVVDAWLAAPSMGRFLAERIEPHHRCPPRGPRDGTAVRVAFETRETPRRRAAVLP